MATSAEVTAYRKAQRDVVDLAYRDLLAFWRTLDLDDPEAAVRALEEFLPELVQAYGEVGASVAADFYDDLRAQSPGARRAYAAVMADAVPIQQVRASARWAAGPLFSATPDGQAALGRVVDVTDRLVKAHGRQTIAANVVADPARPRYARVPVGVTCAFCLTMASRGPVYLSADSAERNYHGHCDCVATPIWVDADLPDGYDPAGLFDKYERARQDAGSGSLKDILSALRKQEGIR